MGMKTTAEKIKIMQAFEDGKKIQWKYLDNKNWGKVVTPIWDWNRCDYRIKPETKYRPYELEEFINLKETLFFCKRYEAFYAVQWVDICAIGLADGRELTYEKFLEMFERVGGAPCGIKIENGE